MSETHGSTLWYEYHLGYGGVPSVVPLGGLLSDSALRFFVPVV